MRLRESVINRRTFISGRVGETDPLVAPPEGEIASALVQVKPDTMADTEAAILQIPGCEIYGRDPRGKLVVVIDAQSAGSLGATLNTIALLPNVYSASLVFHSTDAV